MTDLYQCLQDFTAVEEDSNLFSKPFSADVEGVKGDLQLELIEMPCDGTLSTTEGVWRSLGLGKVKVKSNSRLPSSDKFLK